MVKINKNIAAVLLSMAEKPYPKEKIAAMAKEYTVVQELATALGIGKAFESSVLDELKECRVNLSYNLDQVIAAIETKVK